MSGDFLPKHFVKEIGRESNLFVSFDGDFLSEECKERRERGQNSKFTFSAQNFFGPISPICQELLGERVTAALRAQYL